MMNLSKTVNTKVKIKNLHHPVLHLHLVNPHHPIILQKHNKKVKKQSVPKIILKKI